MKRVKVLQVVYSMNRGGVETWLMHVLRNIDRIHFQVDFVNISGNPGHFDDEIVQLGSRIFTCSPPSRPWCHARDFSAILEEYGPYDVVHSHDQTWDGSVLAIAKRFGVPIRIAHSHNDVYQSRSHGFFKYVYSLWSIRNSKRHATHGFACSGLAAESYFGKNWQKNPRWKVFYCGEDFGPFSEEVDRREIRKSLGIPEDVMVIGHVGSFQNKQKNHSFLISIARELSRINKNIYFLLVGDGILRCEIEEKAAQFGLKDKMIFTGVRSDVPRLMLGAMDLFLFPSLHEGLGLVLVEAQAAGLLCVFSDVIPNEAVVIPSLCRKLSLKLPPSIWSEVIYELLKKYQPISSKHTVSVIENSSFNIINSISILEGYYLSIGH